MRGRQISLIEWARFVDGYNGPLGAAFRRAAAQHFAVTLRTVESDLPRAVSAGALDVETVPARGAPKAYQVSRQYREKLNSKSFGSLMDAVRAGDMPKGTPVWQKLAEANNADPAAVEDAFWLGTLAFCPRCCSLRPIALAGTCSVPGSWPRCPSHAYTAVQTTDKDGQISTTYEEEYMISAWSIRLLQPDDTPEPVRVPPVDREPYDFNEYSTPYLDTDWQIASA